MAVAKILWVDDEIESLQSQKLFLEGKGYEVQTLTNGFDAIDYVKENPVDVVLIDETMPGITGLETLAKIKKVNRRKCRKYCNSKKVKRIQSSSNLFQEIMPRG